MTLASTPASRAPQGAENRRIDWRFVLLCLAVGSEAMGIGMIFPLLARIQHAHHLPTYSLGIMSGGSFLAALIGQLGVSHLLDGRRERIVLLTGLVVAVASLVWFALASDLWQLAASRAAGGLAYGVVGPAALRACTVGVDPSLRGARLGRLSSIQMGGIVLGPLGGIGLAGLGGLGTPFLTLAGLLSIVLVGLVVTTAPSPAERSAEPSAPAVAGTYAAVNGAGALDGAGAHRGQLPALRPVVGLLLLAAAAQLPTGLYDALWSRLLTDRGAGSVFIGVSLTLFGLPIVALAPVGGRLAARRGALVVAAAALAISDLFMASYGFVSVPMAILVLGVFEACFQAVAIPGGFAAVAEVFPDEWAATGQGWFSGAGTAAAGASALVGAPAYAGLGPGFVFGGGALLSGAFIAAAVLVGRGRYRRS